MTLYRLVTGAGLPLEGFDAPDDAVASARGRELAGRYSKNGIGVDGRPANFCVQRSDDGDQWACIAGWMPRPPVSDLRSAAS